MDPFIALLMLIALSPIIFIGECNSQIVAITILIIIFLILFRVPDFVRFFIVIFCISFYAIDQKSVMVCVSTNYRNWYSRSPTKIHNYANIHFTLLPKQNIIEDVILNISSGVPPPLSEAVLENGEVIHNKTTYYHKVTYHFYHMHSVYYRPCYTYNIENRTYTLDIATWLDKHPAKVAMEVDKLIACTSAYTNKFFGDALLGSFCRLVYFPKDVLEGSTIVYPSKDYIHYMREILDLMGVKNCEIVYLDNFEYAFGRELYTVIPTWFPYSKTLEVHHSIYGEFIGGYGEFILKSLGLNKVKAHLYALQNRKSGMKRYLSNFEEVKQMLLKDHPEHNFTLIPHGFDTIASAAKQMVQVKWLFGPGGSNMMHVLYMQPGGCVCMYMCRWLDCSCASCCSSRGVFSLVFLNSECDHMSNSPLHINISILKKHIDRSLKILEDQHL